MHRYFLIGCLVLGNVACYFQQTQTAKTPASIPSMSNSKATMESPIPDLNEIVESFSDESHVGVPHKNKIEINNYKRSTGNLAVIKFYSRAGPKMWTLKQSFEFEKDDLLDCDPHIEDFDNDGLKDVTYVSTVAARGANEVRKLFIYDKKEDELVYITNSEHYPNMLYNKKLNCIDAFLVHGASTTVFLKIDGDTLRQFASVDTGLERVVTLIDKDGKQRILSQKKMKEEDVYTRYITFDPPKPYDREN